LKSQLDASVSPYVVTAKWFSAFEMIDLDEEALIQCNGFQQ